MRRLIVLPCMFLWLCLGVFVARAQNAAVPSAPPNGLSKQAVSAKPPAIVVGFVGGFVRHDNAVHNPVQLAARLRKAYPSGVYVEVFENRRREQAHQTILKLLDTDHDGKLSDEEKQQARIIIYGMSWGGSRPWRWPANWEKRKSPFS